MKIMMQPVVVPESCGRCISNVANSERQLECRGILAAAAIDATNVLFERVHDRFPVSISARPLEAVLGELINQDMVGEGISDNAYVDRVEQGMAKCPGAVVGTVLGSDGRGNNADDRHVAVSPIFNVSANNNDFTTTRGLTVQVEGRAADKSNYHYHAAADQLLDFVYKAKKAAAITG